ncbi:MAG: hypothetical protein AAFM92_11030 [Pseudomonadota bacterium]
MIEDPTDSARRPVVIVGSGWWSTDAPSWTVNPNRKALGDDLIRSVDFFETWLDSVTRAGQPAKIIVVDSASPRKPAQQKRAMVEWLELPFNAKHSTSHVGQWSGWMRSVLVSASYALNCDCDYFVYVEQDCLLEGRGLFDRMARETRTGLVFGSGEGTPQPVQQSLFLVRKDRLSGFVTNLLAIRARDQDLAPEWKFVCASWRPLVWMANLGLLKHRKVRKAVQALAFGRRYEFLTFGTGRGRPIPFEEPAFYFQHATREEVDRYLRKIADERS